VLAHEQWKAQGWDTGWYLRAALSVYRVREQVLRHDEQILQPLHLTSGRHEALAVLGFSRTGQLPLGRLGALLLLHPSSITSTVDALERHGYVERVPDPTDRRTRLARVTRAGRQALARSSKALARGRHGLATLDAPGAERCFELLAVVRADAGDGKVDRAGRVTSPADRGDPVLLAEANWSERGWLDGPWFRAALSVARVTELIGMTAGAVLQPLGLTQVRHETLAVLAFSPRGEVAMGRLSEALLVHPTSMTATVDALERAGYVERVTPAGDRRVTLARITPAGRRAVAQANTELAALRCGVGALRPAQARELFTLLAPVRLQDPAR
jgi:DNA-binding MarR family transcriptional regulator